MWSYTAWGSVALTLALAGLASTVGTTVARALAAVGVGRCFDCGVHSDKVGDSLQSLRLK